MSKIVRILSRILGCAFFAGLTFAVTTPLRAGDWATWRGPNLNGIAAEGQTPPVAWSDNKAIVWKTPVPGRGHSSPIVFGDRIFLTTADDSSQTQGVVAFDRFTGKQLWMVPVSQGGFPETHKKNTHATPSVACDGERLFVSFHHHGRIQVSALSLDGKRLWQQNVGNYDPQQYKYGYAPSPMLYQSRVLVCADYEGGGWIAALDGKSGETRWRVARPRKLSFSSPVVANIGGRDQLLISGTEQVASYDPNNGRQLWTTPATTMATCGTMVWDGDLVFASGGYPKSETVCLNGRSGQLLWRNDQKCYEQSMLAFEGHVYAVTDRGIAYCWRAYDGTEMWSARLEGGAVSSSPTLANGNIYSANERGTFYVFKAQPTRFELVARNQLGDEAFATPSICDGQIYMRTAFNIGGSRQEWLYCIGSH
ncbi:MAG: PQQ-binding-like beta-propeller repeat protein [Planctomycetaceae bacterium]|nr:PQQ-binding-like beta-propeller repeat protein [Planctomycetales bacterium]MCB9926715.1 PQQ-binding-like beta-propeller repeat protein [Planctomycetaceae bacterium]